MHSAEALFARVLLIEDEAAHAALIARALRKVVGEVQQCATSQQGLQSLRSFKPDLIVTDLNLPDANPAAHIRALMESVGEIPVVVLTASSSLKDAVAAMQLGASDYIVKSFDENFSEALLLSLTRLQAQVLLRADRRKLIEDMRVLRLAIENSNDGLAVLEPSGAVLYANSAFVEFIARCGGERNNLLSALGERVKKHEILKLSVSDKLASLPSGAVWSTELVMLQDREIAFELRLAAVQVEESAAPRRVVAWLRNISEQKRREKFQRDILSTTTHDLKGPLGAILLSSEMLQTLLKDNSKPLELVLRVASAAQNAISLIDEFLSARRIQEGNFILKPTPNDLRSLVEKVMADYQTIAMSRKIALEVHFEQARIEAQVDALGFSRVLGNLLSNALKFTPKEGSVNVRLRADEKDVHLIVSDSGCGMEAAEVSQIFNRFARLEKHRQTEGSGIGLFVVKSIVNAHGGDIVVTSQVGKGTSFEVSFPRNPPVNERGEVICLDFA